MSLKRFLFGNSSETERLQREQLRGVRGLLSSSQEELDAARSSGLPQARRDYLTNLFGDDPESIERFSQPYVRQYEQDILPQLKESAAVGGAFRSTGYQNQLNRSGLELGERISGAREQARLGALSSMTADYDNAFNRYRQLSMQPLDSSQYGGRGFVGGALNFLSQSGIANTAAKAAGGYLYGNLPGAASGLMGMFGNLFQRKSSTGDFQQ